MGKPYATELAALNETYARSFALPVHPLGVLVRSAAHLPLISIGSGGSLTSAQFTAFLHTVHTGRLAKAVTPLELVSSPIALRNLGVLVLTAGGRNPDVLGCFEQLLRRDAALIGVVCAGRTPRWPKPPWHPAFPFMTSSYQPAKTDFSRRTRYWRLVSFSPGHTGMHGLRTSSFPHGWKTYCIPE